MDPTDPEWSTADMMACVYNWIRNRPRSHLLIKKTDLPKLLHLPTIHGLLRQKRMRWVGHALRRADSDLSQVEVQELALSSKPWIKCLLGDMKELNIKSIKALEDIYLFFQEEGIIPYKRWRIYSELREVL